MALSPGTRLGVYEVTAKIGQGGMGEVYRAHDTKLGRDVALKVLPDLFADDPERLARFQREARVLASLNHPNIASIYGLEESEGVRALVLELVEGPTLAERIAQGAIPVDEALPIAKQIADALEAAHEAGVIHLDLKPANVKVRADGMVKVLDFGLAKALEGDAGGDPSEWPTATAAATRAGLIMGTAAYMSPEQAKGKVVDKRVDVWAFGAVLYEMLTGRRVFEGGNIPEVLAEVIKTEPNWDPLPADMTPALRTYLRRCLQKDARQRVRDIGDVRLAMEGAFETTVSVPTTEAVSLQPVGLRQALPWVAGIVVGSLITGVAVWSLTRPEAISPAPTMRFDITSPTQPLAPTGTQPDVAISPDGLHIVYVSGPTLTESVLMVRPPGVLTGRPLEATASLLAVSPFISPDNQWVGFYVFNARTLQRVSILGGPAIPIGVLPGPGSLQGASWGADDTIIFGTSDPSGLWRVPAGGGEPEELTTPEAELGEVNHAWPEILPGGHAVLFAILSSGSVETAQIVVRNLETGDQTVLIRGGSPPRYSPTGHIVYGIDGTLRAVPFDLDRLEVAGNPVSVLDDVSTKASGAAEFAFSSDGSLVYVTGAGGTGGREGTLVWVNRDGRGVEPIADDPLEYPRHLRLSPDGHRLALTIGPRDEGDLWVYDLEGRPPTPLTFEGDNTSPVWMRGGTRVAFHSRRAGVRNLFSMPADGSTLDPEPLLTGPNPQSPASWSPDGRELIFIELRPETGNDILALPIEGEGEPRVVADTKYNERHAVLSQGGRWLAYVSDVTGRPEIWVLPYPGPGAPTRISQNGGLTPVWSRDARELFYLEGAKMMAVAVETQPEFRFQPPEELFEGGFVTYPNVSRIYDVAPDGRFVMIHSAAAATTGTDALPEVIFVQNWFEELKARVPVP